MQTTYNSLSNYLIGSFNLESTELLYESFTGNRNATDSQKFICRVLDAEIRVCRPPRIGLS